MRRAPRFAQQTEAGMTHVNGSSMDDTRIGPFGGEKNRGIGRFGGEWTLKELPTVHPFWLCREAKDVTLYQYKEAKFAKRLVPLTLPARVRDSSNEPADPTRRA
jgi:hypothetical protein